MGINPYQNHLASVTHVKPGLMRRWLLLTSLRVVNLLARLWFNRGDLAGIPTILSARWVMIDDGRRLLFSQLRRAWESYLNQFIDLSAVIGLNSISTNTFITVGPEQEPFGFPETKFLLWRGAQAEKPFKAYVRQSQVETIVWYSAYPTLHHQHQYQYRSAPVPVQTGSFVRAGRLFAGSCEESSSDDKVEWSDVKGWA